MKTTILKAAAIAMLIIGMTGCAKKSSSPSSSSSNNNKTNNATFSATVGGVPMTFVGTATYNSSFPLITFAGTSGSHVIQIVDLTLTQGTVVSLSSYSGFNSYATYTDGTTTWSTDASHTGTITLSTYNATGKTATGTFYFTGNETSPTAGAGTISITNGTFANVTWQ